MKKVYESSWSVSIFRINLIRNTPIPTPTTLVETMVDTDLYSDMVTTLTSMVDGDEAPSTVDGDEALHGNLLNAPRNLFTTNSSSRQQWWLKKKKNLSRQWWQMKMAEVSKNNTKWLRWGRRRKRFEVEERKTLWGRRNRNAAGERVSCFFLKIKSGILRAFHVKCWVHQQKCWVHLATVKFKF